MWPTVGVMDAVREAIQRIAAEIMAGQIPPVEGARLIDTKAGFLDNPGDLATFADLAQNGDEEAILEQVSLLLADTA